MKTLRYLSLILLFCLAVSSCKKDEEPIVNENIIRLDGENNDAPIFGPGSHIAAVRFPSNMLAPFEGRQIEAVEFFIQDKPIDLQVIIYEMGSSFAPGNIIYAENVTAISSANSWNSHFLTEAIEITASDLWIAIEATNSSDQQIIGCDFGPADANGNWFLPNNASDWTTYLSLTGGSVNINWNIRARMRPQ